MYVIGAFMYGCMCAHMWVAYMCAMYMYVFESACICLYVYVGLHVYVPEVDIGNSSELFSTLHTEASSLT